MFRLLPLLSYNITEKFIKKFYLYRVVNKMTMKNKNNIPMRIDWMKKELSNLIERYDPKNKSNLILFEMGDYLGLVTKERFSAYALRPIIRRLHDTGWDIAEEEKRKYKLFPLKGTEENYTSEQIYSRRTITSIYQEMVNQAGGRGNIGNNLEQKGSIAQNGSFRLIFTGNYSPQQIEIVRKQLEDKGYKIREVMNHRPIRDLFGRFSKKGATKEYEACLVSGENKK